MARQYGLVIKENKDSRPLYMAWGSSYKVLREYAKKYYFGTHWKIYPFYFNIYPIQRFGLTSDLPRHSAWCP